MKIDKDGITDGPVNIKNKGKWDIIVTTPYNEKWVIAARALRGKFFNGGWNFSKHQKLEVMQALDAIYKTTLHKDWTEKYGSGKTHGRLNISDSDYAW